MAKYRKKPIIVEAIQWTGDNEEEVSSFIGMEIINHFPDLSNTVRSIRIQTLEGIMDAAEGDYIIKGIQGEIYPCKPDVFAKSYDLVE